MKKVGRSISKNYLSEMTNKTKNEEIHLEILKILQESGIGVMTNISDFINSINILQTDLEDLMLRRKKNYILTILNELQKLEYIYFVDKTVLPDSKHRVINFRFFARIKIDGVKYLQSEQDAQVTREFIASQKELLVEQTKQIKKQTNILFGALAISLLSLLVSIYQSSNAGIEEQLKELVNLRKESTLIEKEKLKYPTIQPVQTSTSKPSKTTSK